MIPRAALGPPGLADERASPGPRAPEQGLPSSRALSPPSLPCSGWADRLPGRGMAHSARPLRHLKLQLSFVHTDRARAQSPTPWGEHWLSHSRGLEQRGQAGQLRDGAQRRGRGQRRGPPQALPTEVEEKWAVFSSSPFSFLLKTASDSGKEDLKPFTGCPQVVF